MKAILATGAVLLGMLTAAPALAAAAGGQDPAEAPVRVSPLRNNVYLLTGPGGNVTLAVGSDGAILVDSMYAAAAPRLKAAIAGVTSQRVRYLVTTHYHVDHAGGAATFGPDGAVIVGTPELRDRLATGGPNDAGVVSPPVPPGGRPSQLVTDTATLSVGGHEAQVRHPRRAHTDGDSFVYFKQANVLATGDVFAQGRFPNIDYVAGGGVDGVIAAIDTMLAMTNDATIVVPGHGDLTNRAELVTRRAALADARAKVAKLIAENKSEAEVVAAKPLGADGGDRFVRALYNSLKQAS